ncbi:sigma-70 RNA polymerase sigma factor region 4 domain-containing protein [Pricia antarctica]|nr:sigma-70 family RNA polymerase sigma factor [Pricia antarctica]
MNNKIVYKTRKEFHIFVASTYPDLKEIKDFGDKKAFNELLLKDLPQVRRYITKRLNTALSKGNLPRGKYRPDDFIDQLFIEVYDHFDEVGNKADFYPWLFKKADELLDDTIIDEEFDAVFFENIDDFSRPEWNEMEEKFSTDGDGDLVMLEELDDISYPKNDYMLNHVFVEDDKKEIIDKLDKELGEKNIRRHADMVLHYLPLPMRTVFELATQYHFDVEEIAKIRNQSIQEIRELLENARKSLETSFLNRHFADNT